MLTGESHEQRSLAGYSPWGRNESDATEHTCGWTGSEICSVVSHSLWPHELYSPWNSLSQNTGLSSLSLLEEISRASSQARDRTPVSRIAGRFFTSWATRGSEPTSIPCILFPLLILVVSFVGVIKCVSGKKNWLAYLTFIFFKMISETAYQNPHTCRLL